jgi:hypothetical protein
VLARRATCAGLRRANTEPSNSPGAMHLVERGVCQRPRRYTRAEEKEGRKRGKEGGRRRER